MFCPENPVTSIGIFFKAGFGTISVSPVKETRFVDRLGYLYFHTVLNTLNASWYKSIRGFLLVRKESTSMERSPVAKPKSNLLLESKAKEAAALAICSGCRKEVIILAVPKAMLVVWLLK